MSMTAIPVLGDDLRRDGTVSISPRRRQRLQRAQRARLFTRLPTGKQRRGEDDDDGVCRLKKCGVVPVEKTAGVGLTIGASGQAYFGGLQHCGLLWACPSCSAVIRQYRAQDLERGVRNFRDSHPDGEVVLVTLTLRHGAGDALADTLDACFGAWSRGVVCGAGWTRAKKRYGVLGWVRTVEITLGSHGWHPHIHALLFLGRRLSDEELAGLRANLFGRWAGTLERSQLPRPSLERGCRVDRTDRSDGGVGAYISKVVSSEDPEGIDRGSRRVAIEMLRADIKGSWSGLTPFELLDLVDTPRESWARKRWAEYEAATWGRHCLTWSHGGRDLLGLNVLERSDDEIVHEADPEPVTLAVLTLAQWEKFRFDRDGNSLLRLYGLVEHGHHLQARWWLENLVGPVEVAGPWASAV